MSGQTGSVAGDGTAESTGVGEWLRQAFISGAAITIPTIVTLIVLLFVVNFILGLVGPVVLAVTDYFNIGAQLSDLELKVSGVVTLVALVFVVGAVSEVRSGGGIEETFDSAVARIPGVGSVYTSFNEMSELLLSSDSQSFREVKLVEFPTQGSYTVAFVTADAPRPIEEGTDHDEMTTLFMPMAPNPVMGGFVLHVSNERVYDVDITVEEGIQSIVTSGVTVGADKEIAAGDIGEIGGISSPADLSDAGAVSPTELSDSGANSPQNLSGSDGGGFDAPGGSPGESGDLETDSREP